MISEALRLADSVFKWSEMVEEVRMVFVEKPTQKIAEKKTLLKLDSIGSLRLCRLALRFRWRIS